MKRKDIHVDEETWFDLSDAARYLGVHFTTLRRWADAGQVEYIRTPGGRRRFAQRALDEFIRRQARESVSRSTDGDFIQPVTSQALNHTRQDIQVLRQSANSWINRLDDAERQRMRATGHRLMALLLQFGSRRESGEVFLEEGRRIAGEYSQICSGVGMSLPETVQVFLFFRRSILDGIQETGFLGGRDDKEGRRLFHRTNEFFDDLLLELINQYFISKPKLTE